MSDRSVSKYKIAAALALMLALGSGGTLYIYGTGSKLPARLQVADWQAGGLTYAQFQARLDEQIKLYSSMKVRLASPDPHVPGKELSLAELGLTVQRAEADQAIQTLFRAPLKDRIAARWTLRQARLPLRLSIDAAALQAKLPQVWKELYAQQPVPAQRTFGADDSIHYVPEQQVLRIDAAALLKAIEEQLPAFSGQLTGEQALTLTLPLVAQKPAVTVATLQQQGIERKISEFTTTFPVSGQGRIHNIRSTAASIQDLLLAPGETFDYSKIIAQTETRFGFQEAPVILNGKLVPGIGGGICQVSSTLYNAVLRTGLEIVERRNHSLPVSYVPLGQDATFSTGYINFKFRNTSGAYLLIRTVTTDRNVTVKLFGRMPAGLSYDIESHTVETLAPTVKYVHNPALRRGASVKLSSGKPGYVVETYRIVKMNGIVTGRELISKDRYSATPSLIAVNQGQPVPDNGSEPGPGKPIVEDGLKGPVFQ
uniref:G5 domain-containing protein n=1 Tax=Paenibacillus athensensis TaxID=1967502 RepID=A0A4Y8Q6W6_9BACL